MLHGQATSAGMPNHLMLVAWPTGNGNQIATSFRFAKYVLNTATGHKLIHASAYLAPQIYGGSATLTQIYSKVNATNWVLVYKCTNCFVFDDPSQTPFNTSTSGGSFEQGWAQSYAPPLDPTNADSDITQHNNGMGEFQVEVASATQASYSIWASMTATVTSVTGTTSPTSTYSSRPVPTTTFDYVVVGAGAGGIPIADKLSESGKSVLLVEKGVASSARWGGSEYKPIYSFRS